MHLGRRSETSWNQKLKSKLGINAANFSLPAFRTEICSELILDPAASLRLFVYAMSASQRRRSVNASRVAYFQPTGHLQICMVVYLINS